MEIRGEMLQELREGGIMLIALGNLWDGKTMCKRKPCRKALKFQQYEIFEINV